MGAEKDYGIRLYGLPSGYEFGTLVDAILDVSRGDSGLTAETKEALAALPRPVHIQVFSTPT
jgi:alkyl hydroperoxide reductase subunit AhpF